MTPVFLDTVGILAILDEDDQWHVPASRAFDVLTSQRRRTVTTEFVLLECGNAAARRPYRTDIDKLRARLQSRSAILEVGKLDMESAWRAYSQGDAAGAGIVDHVSFTVMRRLGLTEAFTNDRHFEAAEFTVLF